LARELKIELRLFPAGLTDFRQALDRYGFGAVKVCYHWISGGRL
jgi:hypothetical protein